MTVDYNNHGEPECNIAGDDCDGTVEHCYACRHYVCEFHTAPNGYCVECDDRRKELNIHLVSECNKSIRQ